MVADIIETGRDLISIKEKLGHGHFLAWIEAEFGMTRQTAWNMMNAAIQFGGKCPTVLHLPPAALYALASPSTPAPLRERVVERLEAGEPLNPAEVKVEVREAKQAKQAERRAREDAKRSPEDRKKKEAAKRREGRERERARADRDAEWLRKEEGAERTAAFLQDRLGDEAVNLITMVRETDWHRIERVLEGKPRPIPYWQA